MKSKKILTILISALLTFGLCLTGLACGCVDPENPPSGDQKAITMAISASAEKLTVKLLVLKLTNILKAITLRAYRKMWFQT